MQTIMMGKMEMVLPDMYMMNRFMGICFRGPRATSQQRCNTGGGEGLKVCQIYFLHTINTLCASLGRTKTSVRKLCAESSIILYLSTKIFPDL